MLEEQHWSAWRGRERHILLVYSEAWAAGTSQKAFQHFAIEMSAFFTPISGSFLDIMDNNLSCVKSIENIFPTISPFNFVYRIC